MSDHKKYNAFEKVFQDINSNYISLLDEEVKRNNVILENLITFIIKQMKVNDCLFAKLYKNIFFGGSFYDGLRVGKPEEFDLDILLTLPTFAEPTIQINNKPGFVQMQFKCLDKWLKQPEAAGCGLKLKKLVDDSGYLLTSKVRQWIEGIIGKIDTQIFSKGPLNIFDRPLKVTVHKGGPAFTLHVTGQDLIMDIDLVPCFEFSRNHWPSGKYRPNHINSKPEFFIVPKSPKGYVNGIKDRYWRLSFQIQEREIINNKRCLKPCIKLFKYLRDCLKHDQIYSYYIKTVFMWELGKNSVDFQMESLSYCFVTMLKIFTEYIEKKEIPYYWNKNKNLLEDDNYETLTNIANRLKRMIRDIDSNSDNPNILHKYFVRPQ